MKANKRDQAIEHNHAQMADYTAFGDLEDDEFPDLQDAARVSATKSKCQQNNVRPNYTGTPASKVGETTHYEVKTPTVNESDETQVTNIINVETEQNQHIVEKLNETDNESRLSSDPGSEAQRNGLPNIYQPRRKQPSDWHGDESHLQSPSDSVEHTGRRVRDDDCSETQTSQTRNEGKHHTQDQSAPSVATAAKESGKSHFGQRLIKSLPSGHNLRYASILLAAITLGLTGFFAGYHDQSWFNLGNRIFTGNTSTQQSSADLPQASVHEIGKADDQEQQGKLNTYPTLYTSADVDEESTLVLRVHYGATQPAQIPISGDDNARWDKLFHVVEDNEKEALVQFAERHSETESVDIEPPPLPTNGANGGASSLAESRHESLAGDESNSDLIDNQIVAELSADINSGKGENDAPPGDSTESVRAISEARIAAIELRIESTNNRLRVLEADKVSRVDGVSTYGVFSPKLSWPLQVGEVVNSDEQNNSNPVLIDTSKTYTLISNTNEDVPPAVLSAVVGDVIEGFGTVKDIIRYDDGSMMLFMDNGAVYVN